jgi:hypothetical protein
MSMRMLKAMHARRAAKRLYSLLVLCATCLLHQRCSSCPCGAKVFWEVFGVSRSSSWTAHVTHCGTWQQRRAVPARWVLCLLTVQCMQ